MIEYMSSPEMWVALFQIAVINVLLSGDNAVVIALACRSLPEKQQKQAFAVGAAGIVVLMTALTGFAAYLLTLPYLEIIGSVLLLWIGIKLLVPEDEAGEVSESGNFWGAVKTIIIADIVMSLDNVLGMAGAARGHLGMLFVGMVITIPLILFGSAMIMKLMERFPIFITGGAGLLGYVAGEMAIADPGIKDYIATRASFLETLAPIVGALSVVIVGKLLARSRSAEAGAEASAEPQGVAVAEAGSDLVN
jgi:YjbE family integral membrane protein